MEPIGIDVHKVESQLCILTRQEGAQRGLAYVRSVEEALEVYFFSRLPPPMAEALEQDLKDLKVSRENYFYSLLDARYRQLITKSAAGRAGSKKPK
jgi:hypothetical protein